MIATIAKIFTFDAAHRLDRLPTDHKCHGMHGHTYVVELVFTGEVGEVGFVLDYAEIDALWQPLHNVLDHKVLNDVPGLEVPSTEHVAGWIFTHISNGLGVQSLRVDLDSVRVRESTSTWCVVWAENITDNDFARYVTPL
jgi:6-pyruvoyltetrahydropterin/6-carboxytetrahydropterin synthase